MPEAPVPRAEVPATAPEVPAAPAGASEVEDNDDESGNTEPKVIHALTLTQNEKNKLRRIVTPKPMTGHLEVSQDIFEMWQTKDGKQKLYAMWAKAGGVKARCSKSSFPKKTNLGVDHTIIQIILFRIQHLWMI